MPGSTTSAKWPSYNLSCPITAGSRHQPYEQKITALKLNFCKKLTNTVFHSKEFANDSKTQGQTRPNLIFKITIQLLFFQERGTT